MNTWKLESSLNSAGAGADLARAVLSCADPVLVLDFSDVQVITPSFANAFIMTLLAECSVEELRARLSMTNRSNSVIEALNTAVVRYQRGIRLSGQRAVAV